MLENWQKNEPILLIADDGENEQEYRLTFGTMSAFDEAKFKTKRGRALTHLSEEYGDYAERDEDAKDESLALLDIMVKHAAILSSLRKVEVKDGDEWQEAKLPEQWYSMTEFPRNAPAIVLDSLFDAVLAAGNPMQLFSFLPTSEDEKKMIRLSVSKSES